MLVYFHAPPRQEIKYCHRPRDARTEVGPHTMATFLLWKTVVSIDNTVSTSIRVFQVPRGQTFMLTGLPVFAWNPVSVRTIMVSANWAIRLKMRVVDIGGGTVPRTNQPPLVQDKTELASDDPPMIALAFLADLRWATPFPHGVNQLNPVAVGDTQHRRCRHKPRCPRRVGRKEPGQAGALWHLGEQGQIIARQPPVERAHPSAFDGKQQGQGHDFTG